MKIIVQNNGTRLENHSEIIGGNPDITTIAEAERGIVVQTEQGQDNVENILSLIVNNIEEAREFLLSVYSYTEEEINEIGIDAIKIKIINALDLVKEDTSFLKKIIDDYFNVRDNEVLGKKILMLEAFNALSEQNENLKSIETDVATLGKLKKGTKKYYIKLIKKIKKEFPDDDFILTECIKNIEDQDFLNSVIFTNNMGSSVVKACIEKTTNIKLLAVFTIKFSASENAKVADKRIKEIIRIKKEEAEKLINEIWSQIEEIDKNSGEKEFTREELIKLGVKLPLEGEYTE